MSESRVPLQYRQGDVLLVGVKSLPRQTDLVARERGRVVLAHGEATGHAHAISHADAELRQEWGGRRRRFLVVHGDAPLSLEHEEHAVLHVAPGVYEVRRQRELLGRADWSRVRD